MAEQPATSYNPLFIYGDAGLGKTHLLHAIGHYVRSNYPQMCVRYVSTEHFLNDFIDAIRTNSQGAFKLRYRRCDVLLVDDVQLIENKATTQEEFFHTFDYLHSAGRQIVISSDRPPKAMATLEDRLRSRFGWGLITDVQPPHLETRLAILRKKAAGEPSKAPDDVLTYIATHITNNIRELEGALNRVLAFSNLQRIPLTLEMAEDVLGDLITAKAPRQITAKVVIEATADMFGLTDRRAVRQEPQPAPRHRPPGGHVRAAGDDRLQLPGHRPGLRRPRPHHRHARGVQDLRPHAGAAHDLRAGHRAHAPHPHRRRVTAIRTSGPCSTGGRALPLPVDNRPVVPSDTHGIPVRCLTPVGGWGHRVGPATGSRLRRRHSFPNPQPLQLSLSFSN